MNAKINSLDSCGVTNTAKTCISGELLTLQRYQLYDQAKTRQPKPKITPDLS